MAKSFKGSNPALAFISPTKDMQEQTQPLTNAKTQDITHDNTQLATHDDAHIVAHDDAHIVTHDDAHIATHVNTQYNTQYNAQLEVHDSTHYNEQEHTHFITHDDAQEHTPNNIPPAREGYIRTQGRKGHKKPRINLAFDSKELLDTVRHQADLEGKSITQLMNEAITIYLASRKQ